MTLAWEEAKGIQRAYTGYAVPNHGNTNKSRDFN